MWLFVLYIIHHVSFNSCICALICWGNLLNTTTTFPKLEKLNGYMPEKSLNVLIVNVPMHGFFLLFTNRRVDCKPISLLSLVANPCVELTAFCPRGNVMKFQPRSGLACRVWLSLVLSYLTWLCHCPCTDPPASQHTSVHGQNRTTSPPWLPVFCGNLFITFTYVAGLAYLDIQNTCTGTFIHPFDLENILYQFCPR